MLRTLSYIFLLLVFCACSSVYAEIAIGVERQTGWSDNTYFGDPDGWGWVVSKSLPHRMSLRFSFSRTEYEGELFGIMQFGMPPPNPDTTREPIHTEASADFYEFSLHYVLIEGTKMRLEVGAGVGGARLDLNLLGGFTGKTISSEQSPGLFTLSGEVTVKEFLRPPLSLRLGYKYRTMPSGVAATDGFEPFDDVKYSSIHAAVLARW